MKGTSHHIFKSSSGIVSSWRNLALQFAPAGRQSGSFQNVSARWIVIQRERKCKAIWVCAEMVPQFLTHGHNHAFQTDDASSLASPAT
jgi:hypothetical protein